MLYYYHPEKRATSIHVCWLCTQSTKESKVSTVRSSNSCATCKVGFCPTFYWAVHNHPKFEGVAEEIATINEDKLNPCITIDNWLTPAATKLPPSKRKFVLEDSPVECVEYGGTGDDGDDGVNTNDKEDNEEEHDDEEQHKDSDENMAEDKDSDEDADEVSDKDTADNEDDDVKEKKDGDVETESEEEMDCDEDKDMEESDGETDESETDSVKQLKQHYKEKHLTGTEGMTKEEVEKKEKEWEVWFADLRTRLNYGPTPKK